MLPDELSRLRLIGLEPAQPFRGFSKKFSEQRIRFAHDLIPGIRQGIAYGVFADFTFENPLGRFKGLAGVRIGLGKKFRKPRRKASNRVVPWRSQACAIASSLLSSISAIWNLRCNRSVLTSSKMDPHPTNSRTSATSPATAAAATIAGLISRVRPVGLPCRPLKLRLDDEAHSSRP